MISENCSIGEFVDSVKDREAWEVIVLAVDEATSAERMSYHITPLSEHQLSRSKQYSRHLKRLINYLRYAVKMKRPEDEVYHLYKTYWEDPQQDHMRILWMPDAADRKGTTDRETSGPLSPSR